MQMLIHNEKKVLSETIRAYEAQSGKKVFLNFDRQDTFDAETKKTMKVHCTLEFYRISMDCLVAPGIKERSLKMAEQKIKKERSTHFNYNRLWKLLIDRGIQKQELQKQSDVSAASIAKMGRCENVTTDVLLRICEALDCNVEDIMERVPNIAKEKNTES